MLTRRTATLAICSAAIAPSALAKKPPKPRPPPPMPPHLDQLRSLELTRPDKTRTTLGAELGAPRPLAVSLWAAWCAPCLIESKMLSIVRSQAKPENLEIMGINIDQKPDDRKIEKFLSFAPANYTQLRGRMATTYSAFGGSRRQIVIPRLFIFARDGTPLNAFGGYDPEKMTDEIVAAINAAMKT